jgi:TetR/AcrR family transcriptional regulator, transcriptional repressor for nem operon
MISVINRMFIISGRDCRKMSLKARHNQKVRARVLRAAGEAFRRDGFERARIDDVMRKAGLTRGAFYAHYASKSALLPAVLRDDDLLLGLLRNRSTACPDALFLGMRHIFRALLDPAHRDVVAGAWNLPALMREVQLGSDAAQEAYETALRETLAEMARGVATAPDHPALSAALGLSCGAIAMSVACGGTRTGDDLLRAASATVMTLLDGAHLAKPAARNEGATGRASGVSVSAA